jgi:hypothetical protein
LCREKHKWTIIMTQDRCDAMLLESQLHLTQATILGRHIHYFVNQIMPHSIPGIPNQCICISHYNHTQ